MDKVKALTKYMTDRVEIEQNTNMLSNLASYLMGGVSSAVPASSAAASSTAEVAQGTVIAPEELRCTEDEDWLLVHSDPVHLNASNDACFAASSTSGVTSISSDGGSGSSSSTRSCTARTSPHRSAADGEIPLAPSGSGRSALISISQHRMAGDREVAVGSETRAGDNLMQDSGDGLTQSDTSDTELERSRQLQGSGTNSDDSGSDDCENCAPIAGLEDSWYVAPSACRARRRPVKLATSPLENLLIEHPSMSVYRHSVPEASQKLSSSADSASPVTIDEADENLPAHEEEMLDYIERYLLRVKSRRTAKQDNGNDHINGGSSSTKSSNSSRSHIIVSSVMKQVRCLAAGFGRKQDLNVPITTATPTVPHLKSQKVSLEASMLGGRISQKKERANRTQLDRLNKCRVSSSQQKLRRSDRQHSNKNSFANNNRKSSCQRMC